MPRFSMDRAEDPLRRERRLMQRHADRIGNRIRDRARRHDHRRLADALGAVRAVGGGELQNLGANLRHFERGRQLVEREVRILNDPVLDMQFLGQRPADALHRAAVHLPFDIESD